MERGVRYFGMGLLFGSLGLLTGCGGGGSLPTTTIANTQVVLVQDNQVLTQGLDGSNPSVVGNSTVAGYTAVGFDGHTLAVPALNGATVDVTLVDTRTGSSHLEFTGLRQSSIALSPDSMALACIDDSTIGVPPQVKTIDRLTGTTSNWGPAISDMIIGSGMAWDPLNRYIAVPRQQNNQLVLLSRSTVSAPIVVGAGTQPAFSPDGSQLAYVTPSGDVALYNVGSKTNRILKPTNIVDTVSFSRDGKSLLVTARRQTEGAFFISTVASMSLTTGQLTYLATPDQAQEVLGTVVK